CQMNVRDSEIILGMLQERGYAQVGSVEEADVVLFNTCAVRRQAEQRAWSNVGMLGKRGTRDEGRGTKIIGDTRPHKKIIGLVGCMAQAYQDEIFRRAPQVGLVCGPANIYDIPQLITKARDGNAQVLAVDRQRRPLVRCDGSRSASLKAFVSVMYGCNNFCSYCIVPYVRGREVSRPLKHILDEAKGLAGQGVKEITLLGQNVNSYGKDLRGKINFVRLLEKLDRIEGIERIRFLTSHPKDASKELFGAMRDLPRLCEHLHLPLQAGSDRILKLMNRGYTLKDYLKLIDALRSLNADCSISTDIIAGFPGESEADFQKTHRALQRIQFDEAFIFKYSPRPKTKAAQLKDDVPLEIKQRRNQALLKLQEEISLKKNKSLLGGSVRVLTEGPGNYFGSDSSKANMLQGRSRANKVTLFSGKRGLISQIVNVRINRVTTHTLIGEVNGKKN
ncbi:MAG: tRNA (N6-isopentenyl adenosine(37)-C2)-methylthiotransferase MiaB, partial [Candidatus Omnitrophica bacterium]|nr:tRNA (N6-isopentenyl adenosine(37)-C2)-methylthiotransferase MiaB [Candidatus Omnitrophota bacterium]